jgi:flagellum-specific ATP synthase
MRVLGQVRGRVAGVAGHEVQVRGLRMAVGDVVGVHTRAGVVGAEVVGIGPDGASAVVLGDTDGIGRGDPVVLGAATPLVVGDGLRGRVIDALGRPLDGGPPVAGQPVAVEQPAPPAMRRRRVDMPLPVGVRVIDALTPVGRGQRIGIFAGSGVGKSTLLGMMVRGTVADLSVVCMVGERGREVREFVEDELGPDGLARSVVVVATSDEPPLVRRRAVLTAQRIAEYFADQGADVLLTVDSLTRLAMAQRDIGLAAGEPPTARGYTPSVFSLLPRVLERAGPRERGTVTAFYTVLVDGDDMNEPIADAARSILDGHLVLDRRLATRGHWPAIDPLVSLSRVGAQVTTPEQQDAATAIRTALAAAEEVRDLVEVGAYVAGTNPQADRGLAMRGEIERFLRQRTDDLTEVEQTWAWVSGLADQFHADVVDAGVA